MFRNRRNSTHALTANPSTLGDSMNSVSVFLRSTLFNILFFGSFIFLFVINSPALLFPKPPFYFSKWVTRYLLWLLKVICRLDHKIEGQGYIPKGSCVFASKHQSSWETIIFQALYPDIVYVIKKELTYIPIYGQFITKYKQIIVDRKRGRQALRDLCQQAKDTVTRGRKIVIFPEGSRTAVGQKKKYQKGIYAVYKDCPCPVIPVALNSGMFWGRRSWLKYPGTITIKFLPSMPEGLDGDDFMEELTNRIENQAIGC